jgi:hypothetical protein
VSIDVIETSSNLGRMVIQPAQQVGAGLRCTVRGVPLQTQGTQTVDTPKAELEVEQVHEPAA